MSRSRNTPYKGDKVWNHETPGQWSGVKALQREKNRKTRNTFKQAVRNAKDWEELDDQPDYEDYHLRGQAKWDF